jgi:hypothetical protein
MQGDEEHERIVKVWGKPRSVTVFRESKSVWFAVGDYMGESIRVHGSSKGGATRIWIRAATYKGNL